MPEISNHQITTIAKLHNHTRHIFGGCYSANTLPTQISKFPTFLIVNSAMSWESGEHWLLLLFPSLRGKAEFFDSLGLEPGHYPPIEDYLVGVNGGAGYISNSTCYQAKDSPSCGFFCLWFADLRCQNYSYSQCVGYLSPTNLQGNEKIVSSYMSEHMLPRAL